MDFSDNLNNQQPQWQNNPTINTIQARAYEQQADGSTSMNGFKTPPQEVFDSEEMRGSMQKILSENIGEYIVTEFLIGTDRIMRKQGILYHVGRSYITLYDEAINNFIVCDIFSIKFVYFFFPGSRPRQNYNILPNASRTNGG